MTGKMLFRKLRICAASRLNFSNILVIITLHIMFYLYGCKCAFSCLIFDETASRTTHMDMAYYNFKKKKLFSKFKILFTYHYECTDGCAGYWTVWSIFRTAHIQTFGFHCCSKCFLKFFQVIKFSKFFPPHEKNFQIYLLR